MKGERTLVDKPFRYGGIQRNYDLDVEGWRGAINKKCWCCGGDMTRNLYSYNGTLLKRCYPYIAVFKITKGENKGLNRFRTLCRACAYGYGKGVIEMDGNVYNNEYEFNERRFKKSLEKGICYNCKHLKKHNGNLAEYVCEKKGAVVNDTRVRECDDMWEEKQ